MPRSHPVVAITLAAAAVLAGATRVAHAQSVRAASVAPGKQDAPTAAPAGRPPARFAVNHGLCKDFLALAPDLRGLVVAWTAGRYHKLDRWVLEEPIARKVIAGVEQECENAPDALFRYKVVGEIDKLR
ncbi:MAG TPA: HdeA/HdeB family chaperone [Anaeromyxobacter sp.]|nr:HdeA/HdeB family chaperone [Anaeromyxobacter sp.]